MGRKVLTNKMIEQLYQLAKNVYFKKLSMTEAKENAVLLYGINRGTAEGYIRDFAHLLAGEKYIRTMNEQATRYFLDNISVDFGRDALSASLIAVQKHKEYYEKKASKQRYLERILKDYQ